MADTRTKVAKAKGLPPALASRLIGDTEEELTADADALLAAARSVPAEQDRNVSFLNDALRRRRGRPGPEAA